MYNLLTVTTNTEPEHLRYSISIFRICAKQNYKNICSSQTCIDFIVIFWRLITDSLQTYKEGKKRAGYNFYSTTYNYSIYKKRIEYTYINLLLMFCKIILSSYSVNMVMGLVQCRYLTLKKKTFKTVTRLDVVIIKSSNEEKN